MVAGQAPERRIPNCAKGSAWKVGSLSADPTFSCRSVLHMYGLNDSIDLDFLLHKELSQVCIGQFNLQLRFNENVCVSIESGFNYLPSPEVIYELSAEEYISSSMVSVLLGHAISKVEKSGKGNLELTFSNGAKLQIFDDNEYYECYTISGSPDGIIVV
ncbi:hypothetical protein J7643_07655 [bacterium]|nr:hypothetical protein [bacterium]